MYFIDVHRDVLSNIFPFFYVVLSIFIPLVTVLIYAHIYPEWLFKSVLSVALSVLGFKQKRCGTRKFMFSYAERGRPELAKKHLLLVHGFTSSKEEWASFSFFIPSDVHIVIVDLPGHGETSDFQRGDSYTVQTLVKRLHQFVELSGLSETPFHIVGQSLGGAVAGCYAASYPHLVTHLTLICPAMDTPINSPMISNVAEGGDCALLPTDLEGMRNMFSQIQYQDKFLIPWVFMQGMLETRLPKQKFYNSFFKSLLKDVNSYALLKSSCKISAPTQLIWGDNDWILDISGMDVVAANLPNLQSSQIVRNCGHIITTEKPSLAAGLVDSFHRKTKDFVY